LNGVVACQSGSTSQIAGSQRLILLGTGFFTKERCLMIDTASIAFLCSGLKTAEEKLLITILADAKSMRASDIAYMLKLNYSHCCQILTSLHKKGYCEKEKLGRDIFYSIAKQYRKTISFNDTVLQHCLSTSKNDIVLQHISKSPSNPAVSAGSPHPESGETLPAPENSSISISFLRS
jgi:predicted transcriptional regulator